MKRATIYICSALIFGSCVNMLIVVMLSPFVDTKAFQRQPLHGLDTGSLSRVGSWMVERGDGFGSLRIFVENSAYFADFIEAMDWEVEINDVPGSELPGPIQRRLLVQALEAETTLFDCRGWPFLTAWCEYEDLWPDPIQDRVKGGISLDYEDRRGGAVFLSGGRIALPRAIPYRPIWTGLILNTMFYALGPAVMILLFSTAKPRWRLRRGRCPRCNYILGSSATPGCPECGWNRIRMHGRYWRRTCGFAAVAVSGVAVYSAWLLVGRDSPPVIGEPVIVRTDIAGSDWFREQRTWKCFWMKWNLDIDGRTEPGVAFYAEQNVLQLVGRSGWPFKMWQMTIQKEDVISSNAVARYAGMPDKDALWWEWLATVYPYFCEEQPPAKLAADTADMGELMRLSFPIRPLWLGFVGNAIIIGLTAIMVRYGVVMAVGAYRSRREMCRSCGYLLKGSVSGGCPECGWNRPAGEGEAVVSPQSNGERT